MAKHQPFTIAEIDAALARARFSPSAKPNEVHFIKSPRGFFCTFGGLEPVCPTCSRFQTNLCQQASPNGFSGARVPARSEARTATRTTEKQQAIEAEKKIRAGGSTPYQSGLEDFGLQNGC